MPFNRATMFAGVRSIILAALTTEDLALAYDVESEIASQFPDMAPSRAGDRIQLTLAGVDFISAEAAGYAIDADGVHDDALFTINIDASTNIYARGGKGGDGGLSVALFPPIDISTPGVAGETGGTAIRFGCETIIKGAGGLITKGYGGGGGGGGQGSVAPGSGGGGAGGGAALGALGEGGDAYPLGGLAGTDGTAATITANGTGSSGGDSWAGDGGDGGDSGSVSQAGTAGGQPGGDAGVDGDAIDSQGFDYTINGAITVTGDII